MSAPSHEPGRNALLLGELRLPTIARLWSDQEGWPAGRFLGALIEHEVAERARRRIRRHRDESQLNAAKTLARFEFAEVPMLSKAHVMALASGKALGQHRLHAVVGQQTEGHLMPVTPGGACEYVFAC